MTDESQDPNTEESTTVGANPGGSSGDASESSLGSWGAPSQESTWTPIEAPSDGATPPGAQSPESGTGAGRSRRPTAYGLPPVTERSSDLRSSISDSLTTKPPSPLDRLSAAASGAAAAVGSVVSSATGHSNAGSEHAADPAGGVVEGDPAGAKPSASGPSGPSPVEKLKALAAERPEVAIGAAFVGGLLLASILKRLAR